MEVTLVNGKIVRIDSDTVASLLEAVSGPDDDAVQSALEQVLGSSGPNLVSTTAAACLLIPENTNLVTGAAMTVDPDEGLIAAAECVDLESSVEHQPEPAFKNGDDAEFATVERPTQLLVGAAYPSQLSVNDGIIASDGTLDVTLVDGRIVRVDSDTVASLLEAVGGPNGEAVQTALEQVLGSSGPSLVSTTAAACLLIPRTPIW